MKKDTIEFKFMFMNLITHVKFEKESLLTSYHIFKEKESLKSGFKLNVSIRDFIKFEIAGLLHVRLHDMIIYKHEIK